MWLARPKLAGMSLLALSERSSGAERRNFASRSGEGDGDRTRNIQIDNLVL